MVALGKIAQWGRREIREMAPEEFADYLQAAVDVERAANGNGR